MHMTAFAQPELLVDKLVVIGSAKEGGIIQEICPGDQESRVCSHFKLNAEDVVRLKVTAQHLSSTSFAVLT